MIQINLTLLIQTINFWITYTVLHRFLLSPVIARIQKRKQEERELRAEIILKRKDVENFHEEKVSQLSQFQKDASSDYPFYVVSPDRLKVPEFFEEKPQPSAATEEELKAALRKRILDVTDA